MYNIFNKQEALEKLLFTDNNVNTESGMLDNIQQLIKQRGQHTKAVKQLDQMIEQYKNIDTSVVGLYNVLKNLAISKNYKNFVDLNIIDAELFDVSNVEDKLPTTVPSVLTLHPTQHATIYEITQEIPDLPFEICLIKICEEDKTGVFLYLVESSPTQIEGSVILKTAVQGIFKKPFVIHKHTKILELNFDGFVLSQDNTMNNINNMNKEDLNTLHNHLEDLGIAGVIKALCVFEKMSKHSVLVDTIPKTEYINYKVGKERKKKVIYNRPIYYILDKETYNKGTYNINPISKLEYSYAFKVRGHWRRIAQDSLGKDRNGIYNTQGYTWVMDYIKGEGELVKRTRVAKGTI